MKKFILLTFSMTMMLAASAQWPGKGHHHHIPGDSIKHPGHGWWDSVWHAKHPGDTLHSPHPPKPHPGRGWHKHPVPHDTAWHHHGKPPFDTAWHPKPHFPHDTTKHHPGDTTKHHPGDTSGHDGPPKDTTGHPWPPKDTSDHHGPPFPHDTNDHHGNPKDTSDHHGPPPPKDTSDGDHDGPHHGHGHHKMGTTNELRVSPNPARQVIYMDALTNSEGVNAQLYDLTGRFMGYFPIENNSMNIAILGRGQYVFRFTDSDGVIQTGRFCIIE